MHIMQPVYADRGFQQPQLLNIRMWVHFNQLIQKLQNIVDEKFFHI